MKKKLHFMEEIKAVVSKPCHIILGLSLDKIEGSQLKTLMPKKAPIKNPCKSSSISSMILKLIEHVELIIGYI